MINFMTIGAFLPLVCLVPLAGSALSVCLNNLGVSRLLLVTIPGLVAAAALYLLMTHREVPVIAHSVGGYPAGVAIPFVSDPLAALMILVMSVATVACAVAMILEREDRKRYVPALVLLTFAGAIGSVLTGDLFNFFVFIEVMVLPSYALVALSGSIQRVGVGRMFVVVNLLTSTVLLVGVGLVYATAGTVNIAALARLAAGGGLGANAEIALGIVVIALLVKAGTVPAHGWLVRSYPQTSAPVMALFSALHSKVALYAIVRITVLIVGENAVWMWALGIVAVLSILVGALSSMFRARGRQILAFQMTSGVGHILIGVALLTTLAVQAGLVYAVHHIVTMTGLILLWGAYEYAQARTEAGTSGSVAGPVKAGETEDMGHAAERTSAVLSSVRVPSGATQATSFGGTGDGRDAGASPVSSAGPVASGNPGEKSPERPRSLAAREPVFAALLAVGMLSLIGLPPGSGLWGKIVLVQAAAGAFTQTEGTRMVLGALLICAIVLGSIFTLWAMQRLWSKQLWTQQQSIDASSAREPTMRIKGVHLLPGGSLIAASVLIFVIPAWLIDTAKVAAMVLANSSLYIQAVLGGG